MKEFKQFQFRADFLRVGENSRSGDCICLQWGELSNKGIVNPFVMVIDGGFASNAKALSMKLRELIGDCDINILLNTHPHQDHLGGMSRFLDEFKINQVVLHQPWCHESLRQCLGVDERGNPNLAMMEQKGLKSTYDFFKCAKGHAGTRLEEWWGGQSFEFRGTRICVLSPYRDRYDLLVDKFGNASPAETIPESNGSEDGAPCDNSPENNSCYVLAFSFPGKSKKWVLLTSDVGTDAFDSVLDNLSEFGLSPNWLRLFQVPHHGSIQNLNSLQLDKLLGCPEDAKERSAGRGFAVVSVAEHADEEHPHLQIVEWLKERNMKVSTTKPGTYTYKLTVGF